MIPKIIHYCWFGDSTLPEDAEKCIASWKKFCPDYEIRRWDESNFDINCCAYVRQAYEAKKWAFVSDYARFWILYTYGGLYFDTDVELIRSIDDIAAAGPFMGREAGKPGTSTAAADQSMEDIAPGLGLGAPAGLKLYKDILDDYEKSRFELNEKGFYETVVQRVTKILLGNGLKEACPDRLGIVQAAGIRIYPSEYFCPYNFYTGKLHITDNTRSIHHYDSTWMSGTEKLVNNMQQWFAGKNLGGRPVERIATAPLRLILKLQRVGITGTIQAIRRKQVS